MARKEQPIRIASVEYYYAGTDQDFTQFLKAVVYDYLVKDTVTKSEKEDENSS